VESWLLLSNFHLVFDFEADTSIALGQHAPGSNKGKVLQCHPSVKSHFQLDAALLLDGGRSRMPVARTKMLRGGKLALYV